MFGYYLRLNNIENQSGGPLSILKAAFETDKNFSEKENSWTKRLTEISKLININSLNISKETFKVKIQDYFVSKLKLEFSKIKEESSGKLCFYTKIYSNNFKIQEYLKFNCPINLRKKLTKLRISAHSLAIETGRYTNPKTPKTERFCKFCKDKIEDEHHFLFICPKYEPLRLKYNIVNETGLNNSCISEHSVSKFLNPETWLESKNICNFIKEAFDEKDLPTAVT